MSVWERDKLKERERAVNSLGMKRECSSENVCIQKGYSSIIIVCFIMHLTSAQQNNHMHKNFNTDHKILLILGNLMSMFFYSEEVINRVAHMFFSLVLMRASGDLVWCSQCTVWPIKKNYRNKIIAYNFQNKIIIAINSRDVQQRSSTRPWQWWSIVKTMIVEKRNSDWL